MATKRDRTSLRPARLRRERLRAGLVKGKRIRHQIAAERLTGKKSKDMYFEGSKIKEGPGYRVRNPPKN